MSLTGDLLKRFFSGDSEAALQKLARGSIFADLPTRMHAYYGALHATESAEQRGALRVILRNLEHASREVVDSLPPDNISPLPIDDLTQSVIGRVDEYLKQGTGIRVKLPEPAESYLTGLSAYRSVAPKPPLGPLSTPPMPGDLPIGKLAGFLTDPTPATPGSVQEALNRVETVAHETLMKTGLKLTPAEERTFKRLFGDSAKKTRGIFEEMLDPNVSMRLTPEEAAKHGAEKGIGTSRIRALLDEVGIPAKALRGEETDTQIRESFPTVTRDIRAIGKAAEGKPEKIAMAEAKQSALDRRMRYRFVANVLDWLSDPTNTGPAPHLFRHLSSVFQSISEKARLVAEAAPLEPQDLVPPGIGAMETAFNVLRRHIPSLRRRDIFYPSGQLEPVLQSFFPPGIGAPRASILTQAVGGKVAAVEADLLPLGSREFGTDIFTRRFNQGDLVHLNPAHQVSRHFGELQKSKLPLLVVDEVAAVNPSRSGSEYLHTAVVTPINPLTGDFDPSALIYLTYPSTAKGRSPIISAKFSKDAIPENFRPVDLARKLAKFKRERFSKFSPEMLGERGESLYEILSPEGDLIGFTSDRSRALDAMKNKNLLRANRFGQIMPWEQEQMAKLDRGMVAQLISVEGRIKTAWQKVYTRNVENLMANGYALLREDRIAEERAKREILGSLTEMIAERKKIRRVSSFTLPSGGEIDLEQAAVELKQKARFGLPSGVPSEGDFASIRAAIARGEVPAEFSAIAQHETMAEISSLMGSELGRAASRVIREHAAETAKVAPFREILAEITQTRGRPLDPTVAKRLRNEAKLAAAADPTEFVYTYLGHARARLEKEGYEELLFNIREFEGGVPDITVKARSPYTGNVTEMRLDLGHPDAVELLGPDVQNQKRIMDEAIAKWQQTPLAPGPCSSEDIE